MFTYIGLHSNGQKSRPGHKWDENSAIYQFLQTPGTRAFNSFLFNCNPLGMKTASGDKLRAMIAQAEVYMRELEAFLIKFQDERQKLPFGGMQQMSINKKIEPLRTGLAKQASVLCKTAQLFDFSKSGRKATPKAGFLCGADLPFFIINEIKN
ncbi:uncharacterized protein LOC118436601 [Folsomia candida]|nr:uncharacterized protein LOC118436601 [Folsomia candida]